LPIFGTIIHFLAMPAGFDCLYSPLVPLLATIVPALTLGELEGPRGGCERFLREGYSLEHYFYVGVTFRGRLFQKGGKR